MPDHHHPSIMSICLFHVGGVGGYPQRCSAKLAAGEGHNTYNAPPHEETNTTILQEIYGDDTKRCSILF